MNKEGRGETYLIDLVDEREGCAGKFGETHEVHDR